MANREEAKAFSRKVAKVFGEELRRRRRAQNMSQLDIAQFIHKSQQVVNAYEKGKAIPNLATAHQIALLLGATLDEMTQGKNGNDRSRISDKL